MNTPITDKFIRSLPREYDWSDACCNRSAVEDFARRLEADRATFRQALIDIYLSLTSDSRALANAALQAASKFEGEEHTP